MTYSADEIAEMDHRIAIFQACKAGRKVEWRFPGNPWGPLHSMPRIWDNIEYRIAPEPRKPRDFWLQWDVDGQLIARTAPATQFGEVLHVREVLPD